MITLPITITSPTTATVGEEAITAESGGIHAAVFKAAIAQATQDGTALRATVTAADTGRRRDLFVYPDGEVIPVDADNAAPPATPAPDRGHSQTQLDPAPNGPAVDPAPPTSQSVPQPANGSPPLPRTMQAPPVPAPDTPTWDRGPGPQGQPQQDRGGQSAAPANRPHLPQQPRHSGEIGREVLFRPTKRPPQSGWRRFVHRVTGGGINPGESTEDVRRRQLVERVGQSIRGDYKIAVLSLKGGVGKTTTTVSLGSTFASLRGDRVVAVDANPDRGTLAGRIPTQTPATVRDLLNDVTNLHRYSDVRAFTSQAPSRLEVLASERDPHKSEAFSETDYRSAMSVLEGFYNLILTDCGTGLTHSAMRGVLGTADALVLVSSPALDGAQSADATLTWLEVQGYGHLVERTVVVISSARPGSSTVNMNQLVAHFEARVRAVQVIPFDAHLSEGSEVDLERLSPAARDAFVDLAALVADDFPEAAGRHHGPAQSASPAGVR